MALIASNFVIWMIVLLLAVAVAALARQIALLQDRVAALAVASPGHGGPVAGDPAPVITTRTTEGKVITIGGANPGRSVLLLFIAPNCPASRKIVPVALVTARAEELSLVFVGEGDAAAYDAMRAKLRIEGYDFVASPDVPTAYHVAQTPSAVLIGPDGIIAARGLVDTREHLRELVAPGVTGQTVLQHRPRNRRVS